MLLKLENREDVLNWLNSQPREVNIVIASRTAMRVFPIIGRVFHRREKEPSELRTTVVLPIFRVIAISWIAAKYPTHNMALRKNATAASDATDAAVTAAASDAAIFAADAATTAVFANEDATAVFAASAAAATTATTGVFAADAAIYKALSTDADIIDKGGSVSELIDSPLWSEQVPQWFEENWQQLQSQLSSTDATDENWQVWTNWFNARITGTPAIEKLELARATIDNDIWKQGPKVVNAHIQALIDEFEKKSEIAKSADQPLDVRQRPAAFHFKFENGAIRAVPVAGHPVNPSMAEQTWQETVQKAREFLEKLEQTQSPARVLRTIERLLETLGNSVADVMPGILLARSRSLASDASAFDTAEARAELFPDAVSMMQDLLASVEDLKAHFSEILELESDRLAQKLSPAELSKVQSEAEQIVEIAKHAGGLIDESAVNALEMTKPDIAETVEVMEATGNEKVIADAHRNRALLISQWTRDLRNFAAALFKGIKRHGNEFGTAVEQDLGKKLGDGFQGGLIKLAEKSPQLALVVLVGHLGNAFAAIAVAISTFEPFAKRAKEIETELNRKDGNGQLDA